MTTGVWNPISGGFLAAEDGPGVSTVIWYSDVGPFADSEFSVFESDIEWLADQAITVVSS